MSNVKVYFVHSKHLYELMLAFNTCNYVNWTQQGMKILLCKYHKVNQYDNMDLAITTLSKWDGNQITNKIGRSVLRIGDIFLIKDTYYLFTCKRLVKIPDALSKRLLLYDN